MWIDFLSEESCMFLKNGYGSNLKVFDWDGDFSWTVNSRGHFFSKWANSSGHFLRVNSRGHFW